jgi:hypothetical protein
MLTAVESFFSNAKEKEDAKKAKQDSKVIEGKAYSDCLKGEVTVEKNSNANKSQLPNAGKVNTTMASFFSPLPIITTQATGNDNSNKNETCGEGQKPQVAAKTSEVWHVARYGRIYKRKAASKVGFAHIQCPPGHRYCKECEKPMPLDKFYVNAKRYICKRHHYLRVNKRFKERVLSSDYEKMAEIAWLDLYRISPMLGYAKVDYDRHDIKDLVINTKIPLSVLPRAVPIDPSIPMRPRNVAIVSSANMALLLKIYVMTCSKAQYILLVQSCNLLPENADAGVPWAPFHNPDYIRKDIDVIPILEKESTMPKELPHVEAVREMMQEDENKINACKTRLGREDSMDPAEENDDDN